MKHWIGVDLDGTLAVYDGWKGVDHIGAPIPAMVERVQRMLRSGAEVRIFTARVAQPTPDERDQAIAAIEQWCEEHLGRRLPVTNVKDWGMTLLYDDRCVQIERNTGRRMDGRPDGPTTP